MAIREISFHLSNGDVLVATDEEAADFAEALQSGDMNGEWVIFPVNERTGFQKILHLTHVTHVDQLHTFE